MNNKKQSFVLLLIPLAFLFVFFYYPLIFIFKSTLYSNGSLSFDSFNNILSQSWQRSVIFFTFKQALFSLILTLIIAMPLTIILSKYHFWGKKFLKAIMMIPFVLPGITVALGFILFYGNSGYLNTLLSMFNIKVSVLYSLKAIIIAHAFYNVPMVVKVMTDTLDNFNQHLITSARTLGASKFVSFFKITIPCILPALINVSILVFLYCFMSFGIVLVLGDIRFTTIEVNIYILIKQLLETQLGFALCMIQIMFSMTFLILSFFYKHRSRAISQHIYSAEHFTLPLFQKINFQKCLSIIYLVLFILFVLSPLFSIIIYTSKHAIVFFKHINTYNPIIGTYIWKPIFNSFLLAFIVALMTLIICLVFRYCLHQKSYRRFVELLILLPMGVSGVSFSLAYLFIFQMINIPNILLLIFAHVIICLPFAYTSVSYAFDKINANLIYSAQSLGADSFTIFKRLILPNVSRPLLSSFIFSLALSLGEISSASMLSDRFITIPVSIYRFISARQFDYASSMSLVLIMSASIVFIFSEKINHLYFVEEKSNEN